MTKHPEYELKVPAIARLLMRGEAAGIPSIVSSFFLLVLVLLSGAFLERQYGIALLTRSSLIALTWLAIGPWLIHDAVRLSHDFLESYRPYFPSDDAWLKLLTNHMHRLSVGWMRFGVPWGLLATTFVVQVLTPDARGFALVWVVVAFGALFLISGMGFWGVWALMRLVEDFTAAGVQYRPYHPDRFGGMASVGNFSARAALYFSSGAVVLPLAFDIVARAQTHTPSAVPVLAYLLTATFICFALAAFVIPIAHIKRFPDGERVRVTEDARCRLDSLIQAYNRSSNHDEQLARRIGMCYEMECAELARLREYPYDLSVAVQLFLSIAIPVVVVVIESLLR